MRSNAGYIFLKTLSFFAIIFVIISFFYKKNLEELYKNELNLSIKNEIKIQSDIIKVAMDTANKDILILADNIKLTKIERLKKSNFVKFLEFHSLYTNLKLLDINGEIIIESSSSEKFNFTKLKYFENIEKLEKFETYLTPFGQNFPLNSTLITPIFDDQKIKIGYILLKLNFNELTKNFKNTKLIENYIISDFSKNILDSNLKQKEEFQNYWTLFENINNEFMGFKIDKDYYIYVQNIGLMNQKIKIYSFINPKTIDDKVNEYLTSISWIMFLYFFFAIFISFIHSETKAYNKKIEKKVNLSDKIFENSYDAILIANSNNKIIRVNKAFTNITGYKEDDVLYKDPSILKFPGFHTKEFYKSMWESIEKNSYWEGEITNLRKNRSPYTEELSINKITTIDGEVFYMASFVDITDYKINKTITEKKINESKTYLEIINDYLLTLNVDVNGRIINVSNKLCEVSGYTKEELIGNDHDILRNPETEKSFYIDIWNKIYSGETWEGELTNLAKNGRTYYLNAKISPLYKDKKIVGYASVAIDITDKKRVEKMSVTDELTNIYNRRFFNITLQKELSRAKRDNKNIALVILDIDYFKEYNDTYGHSEGDKALKSVAKTLEISLNRASDYCFRLGGEEFGILISDFEEEKFKGFLEKIRINIEDLNIEHKNSKINKNLTVSIGAYISNSIEMNEIKLYKLADQNLYTSKNNGRNQVTLTSFRE